MQHELPPVLANAASGFSLTLEEVESILDHLVETEGDPEVAVLRRGALDPPADRPNDAGSQGTQHQTPDYVQHERQADRRR